MSLTASVQTAASTLEFGHSTSEKPTELRCASSSSTACAAVAVAMAVACASNLRRPCDRSSSACSSLWCHCFCSKEEQKKKRETVVQFEAFHWNKKKGAADDNHYSYRKNDREQDMGSNKKRGRVSSALTDGGCRTIVGDGLLESGSALNLAEKGIAVFGWRRESGSRGSTAGWRGRGWWWRWWHLFLKRGGEMGWEVMNESNEVMSNFTQLYATTSDANEGTLARINVTCTRASLHCMRLVHLFAPSAPSVCPSVHLSLPSEPFRTLPPFIFTLTPASLLPVMNLRQVLPCWPYPVHLHRGTNVQFKPIHLLTQPLLGPSSHRSSQTRSMY